MTIFRGFGMFILFSCSLAAVAKATMHPVPRTVLAIWDRSDYIKGSDYTHTNIHKKIEVVFNHYGLKLKYLDVHSEEYKQIKEENLKNYAGIVTWFLDQKMVNPHKYIKWLKDALRSQLKVLILGELGFTDSQKVNVKDVNELLSLIHLQYGPEVFTNPLLFEEEFVAKRSWLEFERKLEREISKVANIKSLSKNNNVWLRVHVKNVKKSVEPVVLTKNAGYVQSGFVQYEDEITHQTQWRVNPFVLVKKLFVQSNIPIPDTTTLFGNRIFYTHIDGDGFINISRIDRKSLSGEVIIHEIIKKYQLPTTASIVVAEIDPELLGSARSLQAAKDMYALANIEPASHTYSHPLSWRLQPTDSEIKLYRPDNPEMKGPIVAYNIPNYTMNYEMEIIGSLNYMNKNIVKNRKAKVLLWSGSCKPPLEAMKLIEKDQLYNLNGGDSKFDNVYNSYGHLAPLYRMVGNIIQFYSSNANENLYTNLWRGPFNGFKDVVRTFENTETPFRIKPVNIYYHFYSGEHQSSIDALNAAYSWAMKQEIIPIYVSDYVNILNDFIHLNIYKVNETEFEIEGSRYLKTFRLPGGKLVPDYLKSQNVIGHRLINGELYVSLGEGDRAKLVLTRKMESRPYLFRLNNKLRSFRLHEQVLELDTGLENPMKVQIKNTQNLKRIIINGKSYAHQGEKEFLL